MVAWCGISPEIADRFQSCRWISQVAASAFWAPTPPVPHSPSRHISVRQLILGDTRNFSGVIDTSVFASFLVSSETSAS